jgi:hypothetical protein
MPRRAPKFLATFRRIARIVEEDYNQDFAQRFHHAARLRHKKAPLSAVDEIRNAFDHLANAIVNAASKDRIFVGAGRRRPPPPHARPIPKRGPLLDVLRARKHILAGQFYSVAYSIAVRDQDITRILHSRLVKDSEAKPHRTKFNAIKSKWKPLRAPSDQRMHNLKNVRTEIARLEKLNPLVDSYLNRLERFYKNVKPLRRRRYRI